MLFHTWDFVIYFTIVMSIYSLIMKTKFRIPFLWIVSYIFYGWWDFRFLLLIFVSSTTDYFCGRGIASGKKRKFWLILSLVVNLGMLCFFKYMGFLTENLRWLFEVLHIPLTIPETNILLPVGISFFTFQSMSYTIDVYLGHMREEKKYINYLAFVSLFPQLVAGPIERASELLPQIRHTPVIRKQDVSDGISLFLTGLFKKAIMADFLAIYVDKVYPDPASQSGLALLIATFCFAWQIYFDFSGYSDMARGIARIMGIRLMLNFNNPYTAVDVRDFWRRWHISLSTWFKDYVYIPMGGNRGIKIHVWWNVFFTMLVSGFWHGAAWTFIIWGALNGLGSIVSMQFDKAEWYKKIPKIVKQLITFIFISFTWIFFRAESFDDAMTIIKRIGAWAAGESTTIIPLIPLVLVGAIWLYQLTFNSGFKDILSRRYIRVSLLAAAVIFYLVFSSTANTQFIYFQF